MSKQELLAAQIENLCSAVPELESVMLASSDGLPIAHSLGDGADPERLAAMVAAAANLGARVSKTLQTGNVTEVSVRANGGDLFVYSIAGKAVLGVVGPRGANAGLIHIEAQDTARELEKLFG